MVSTTVKNGMDDDNLTSDTKWFFIEKKDGTKIGTIFHFPREKALEIGYSLVPVRDAKVIVLRP